MIRAALPALLAIAAIPTIGCEPFAPSYDEPVCSTQGECPDDSSCAAGVCGPQFLCEVPRTHPTLSEALADERCTEIGLKAGTYRERIEIARAVTIIGATAELVTLDGEASGTVVTIAQGTEVTLRAITIANGLAKMGGGILNRGTLTLDRVMVSGNRALGGAPSGGGIANLGGALTLIGSAVTDNEAQASGSAAFGAGIFSNGGRVDLLEVSEIRSNKIRSADSSTGTITGKGGGLSASSTAVTLRGAVVRDNLIDLSGGTFQADARGGGLWIEGGSLSVGAASLIASNKIYAASGLSMGALATGGGVMTEFSNVDLTASTLRDNVAHARSGSYPKANGGGMSMYYGRILIRDMKILENSVRAEDPSEPRAAEASGGGMALLGEIGIEGSELAGNSIVGEGIVSAGGLALAPTPLAHVERTAIHDNVASSIYAEAHGGGLAILTFGNTAATATVSQSTIDLNVAKGSSAAGGGGLDALVTDAQNLTVEITSSTVSSNRAETAGPGFGGGVVGRTPAGTSTLFIKLASSTITKNSAQTCGGLCLQEGSPSKPSRLSIRDSIVSNNSASLAPDCFSASQILSGGGNRFGEVEHCMFSGSAASGRLVLRNLPN